MISGDFNHAPEGWRKISTEEFGRLFFIYPYKSFERRQLKEVGHYDCNLFELDYPEADGLGVAMANVWRSKWELDFYRFGNLEKWIKFETAFAARFAGDNS